MNSFNAWMTQNVFNCWFTVHYCVTVCGVTSLPFSVRGDESGVERLSHISTAMAVHFLLIYKYIQMLFFFPIQKLTFYSRRFVQYFSVTIQQTYSRPPSTWTNKTSLSPVTVYLDADIAIIVFANYCKILIKLLNWWCDVISVCVCMNVWSVCVCEMKTVPWDRS